MRILWVNGNPNPHFGGTELHTVSMVKELKNMGVDLVLACAPGSFVDKHTHHVKKFYVSFPRSLHIPGMWSLYKAMREVNPHIVIANNGKEYPDVVYLSKLFDKKVVLFRHMDRMKQITVRKLVFPLVDLFLAVSEHVKENLLKEGVSPDKIQVIYNLIDEGRFKPSQKPEHPINILFVGKVDEGKGVWDLLRAFERLTKTRDDVRLYIVGDGRELPRVRAYVEDKAIKDRVHMVGYTDKVEEYYSLSHICVVPSREREAFPRVAIEALASGCALVVSHIGGTKEAVREKENGFVFRAGDVEDLYQKLLLSIENWRVFTQNSLELYRKNFSKERTLSKFLSVLEDLLKR